MKQFNKYIVVALAIIWSANAFSQSTQKNVKWEYLLDENLSKWDKFLGVPHFTVELEGYEKGNGKDGTPIGLNKDPLNVFSVEMEKGKPTLKISGEVYGGLSTKKEYGNYHLSFKYKWGEKKYEPRLNGKRDSGVLYHCQEPHGQFWNVWMKAPEMQVQETDCGDFYALVGVGMDIRARKKTIGTKDYWVYDPSADLLPFRTGNRGSCKRSENFEKPNDEWNHLELICIADKAYHIVNGKIVMVLENSISLDGDKETPLTKGKIQIQSEAAEVTYKEIKICPVTELPAKYAKQLKKS